MLGCYTDRLSARPRETLSLFASATDGPCSLEIARIGKDREVVYRAQQIAVADRPVPPRADRNGCGWPSVLSFEIGDWRSGYYDIALSDAVGARAHHFVCVKPSASKARALFVLATNTYHAYNWWGGANAYCDVTALMSRRAPLPEAMAGAIGVLSAERPFSPLLVAPPSDVPRIVNMRPRDFRERPWGVDLAWAKRHRPSPYDRSAGFLHKWEHVFAAWAEENEIALDYATDYDIETEPAILDSYDAVIVVGHSEYWSKPQRDRIEAFVDRGGKLAIFSGNTCFWKIRWENGGKTLICHKWRGFEAEPDSGARGTHLWSHPAFAQPEAQITGLSFLFGGYHRLGMCVSRGSGGYTIHRDDHWALADTDLFYGDVVGSDLPLIGYENDGCRFEFGDDGLPKAIASLGVTENFEIIASAPCAFGEAADTGYPPLIPPEKLDVCAEIVYGDSSPVQQARMLRGHAIMGSFHRGRGEIFNGGTTEWAHALAAKNPFIERITLNVLKRFGAI